MDCYFGEGEYIYMQGREWSRLFCLYQKTSFRVLYQIFLVHLSTWWCGISPLFIIGWLCDWFWTMKHEQRYGICNTGCSSESQCTVCHARSLSHGYWKYHKHQLLHEPESWNEDHEEQSLYQSSDRHIMCWKKKSIYRIDNNIVL